MDHNVIPVDVVGIFPNEHQTVAVFVGNEEKTFIIHVEPTLGRAIAMSKAGERSERPLTHELIGYIFSAFDIKVERVVINDLRSSTYFARLFLSATNEVHQKHIEIDARPSDSIAIALQAHAPLFVSEEVWEEVDDSTEQLERIREALRNKGLGQHPPEPDFGQDEE